MKWLRQIRLPRFNIWQLLLLTMLIGILLAMVANARRQQPAQAFKAVAFSPDETRILISGQENAQIIRLSDKLLLGTIPIGFSGYGGRQTACFVDDDTVALWSQGNRIRGPASGVYLYSIADAKLTSKMSIGRWGDSMAVSPAGFAVRDRVTSKLTFYPFDSKAAPVSTTVRKSDDRIWLSQSGQSVTLFSGFHQSRGPNMPGPKPSTEILDLVQGTVEIINNLYSDAVLSPDGSRILVAGRRGAELLNRKTQETLWHFEPGLNAEDSRFSSDGSLVAILSTIENKPPSGFGREQFISVLDAESGKEVLRIDTNDRLSSAFAFSPSGKSIAVADSADYFGGVQLWDIPTGKMVGTAGGSNRLQLLILYPVLLLVWGLFWIRAWSARSLPPETTLDSESGSNFRVANETRTAPWRFLFASFASAGFFIIGWFSAICFFTMSSDGIYGQLPIWSQSMAIAMVVGASLFGVWLMVFGIRRMGRKIEIR